MPAQHRPWFIFLSETQAAPSKTCFSVSSRWHRSARKGPFTLRPVSQQSPQGCPRNSVNISLVEHRLFSTLEGGMSAASFLHSSFLQVVNAVMLWPVHVQKVPQASEHLCSAKLLTRCDICSACQSICLLISTDSSVQGGPNPGSCTSQDNTPSALVFKTLQLKQSYF